MWFIIEHGTGYNMDCCVKLYVDYETKWIIGEFTDGKKRSIIGYDDTLVLEYILARILDGIASGKRGLLLQEIVDDINRIRSEGTGNNS